MRILTTTRTGQPLVHNIYDALGEQVGTVASGITNRTDVSYETVSGEVWRVADSLSGETQSVTRERLTGLSDMLRRHTVATGANGVTNEATAVWDEPTRTLAETQTSSLHATPSVRVTKYGRIISETSADGSRNYFFDPYGRVFYTERRPSDSSVWLSETWLGFNDFGDTEEYDTFTGSEDTYTATFNAFNAFGQTITTTDALGHAVTNFYDALGRRISTFGVTYPVLYGYDNVGRMKELGTTRSGYAWDTTQWQYDPTTGLSTAKTYADNSTVAYTHTPDGKPLRTTWARGAWRESSFSADGLLTATTYSDATPAVALAYDTFQHIAGASNVVAVYTYVNDNLGAATNETTAIGTNTHTLVRAYDGFHRLASLAAKGDAVHYTYGVEGRFSTASNTAFTSTYAYTPDGLDAGWTVTVANGTTISRTLTRDIYRRSLFTAITNCVDGVPVNPLTFSFDALNRVVSRNDDSFDYNARSEVTSSTIQPSSTNRYEYDGIGNNLWTSINFATNTYTANALNQYTNIANGSILELEYDPDGNLTWNGRFSYTWDAENRLAVVYSNSTLVISNAYDHMSRRVLKFTPTATHTFIYDGWNLVAELTHTPTHTLTNLYVWGKDLSGTLQGAGGVGGLLAVSLSETWYFPFYDNNGNITAYADESGSLVAQYAYDAFGYAIFHSGPMADIFPHRFSTKYYDAETGLCDYGYRFYSPLFFRWLSRDPIGGYGGNHPYRFTNNSPLTQIDALGLWGTVIHQDRTIQWAQEDGMPIKGATPIGQWDGRVDTDFDPTVISEATWPWHFNRSNAGAEDSRLAHSRNQFEKAKQFCTWKPGRKDDWKAAAKCMGRALHPLQDWVAHGDFNRRQEAPSLTGYGFLEKRFYAHNYSALGGINMWKLPDRPDLDSTGPDGRATISDMTLRGTLSNGDRYYSASFSSGSQRMRLTERRTKDLLRYFRDHVKANGRACGECQRAFLSSSDVYGY